MESVIKLLFDHWIVSIVLIGAVFLLLDTIAEEIRKYACHRNNVELKRDLADRGMSADEIERIVAVGSRAKVDDDRVCIELKNEGRSS